MNKRIAAGFGLSLLALAACAPTEEPESAGLGAALRNADGATVANASAAEEEGRVRVRLDAGGLAPGIYGAHVHTVGRCDPPAFDSAGSHWNPTGRQHGSQNPQGPHLGDLPNLEVGADGAGTLEFVIEGTRLADGSTALMDGDGAAIIVHAAPDDYRTDPSGNSGTRIACGVFE